MLIPTPAPSSTPAASAIPAWWTPLYEPVRIDPGRLQRMELGTGSTAPSPRDLVVRAGVVYFTAIDAAHSDAIWATDLIAGTTKKLIEASDREFTTLDLSGDRLVWSEDWHEDATDVLRVTRWQVRALSLADPSASPVVLASGSRKTDGTVISVVRESPSLVALALADRAGAWHFRVLDARDGHVIRTVAPTAPSYYMVDLAGDRLVWTQGVSNANGMFCHSSLMVDDGSGGKPRALAAGAIVVTADADTVTWLSDPTSSEGCSGLMEHPRTMFGSLAGSWKPEPLGAPADGSPNLGDTDQQTTGGIVAWTEKRDYGESASGASQSNFILALHGIKSGRTVELLDSIGAFAGSALGTGWVAWARYRDDDTYAIEGAALSDVLPAP